MKWERIRRTPTAVVMATILLTITAPNIVRASDPEPQFDSTTDADCPGTGSGLCAPIDLDCPRTDACDTGLARTICHNEGGVVLGHFTATPSRMCFAGGLTEDVLVSLTREVDRDVLEVQHWMGHYGTPACVCIGEAWMGFSTEEVDGAAFTTPRSDPPAIFHDHTTSAVFPGPEGQPMIVETWKFTPTQAAIYDVWVDLTDPGGGNCAEGSTLQDPDVSTPKIKVHVADVDRIIRRGSLEPTPTDPCAGGNSGPAVVLAGGSVDLEVVGKPCGVEFRGDQPTWQVFGPDGNQTETGTGLYFTAHTMANKPGKYIVSAACGRGQFKAFNVYAMRANLIVQELAENSEPSPNEESPGAFIPKNNNYDERNHSAQGLLIPDFRADATAGDRAVANDTDLVAARLTVDGMTDAPVRGRWTITFPFNLKVWRADGGTLTPVSSGTELEMTTSGQPVPLLIEGVATSTNTRDLDISASFRSSEFVSGNTFPQAISSDLVKATVFEIDLYTDSNNDGSLDLTEVWEDRFEDDPQLPGRILPVNREADGVGQDETAELQAYVRPSDLSEGQVTISVNATGSDRIRLLTNSQLVTLPYTVDLSAGPLPNTFAIDGLKVGAASITATYTHSGPAANVSDTVSVQICDTISYTPSGKIFGVWEPYGLSLYSTPEEVFALLLEEGWDTMVRYTDPNPRDLSFGSLTLANFKGLADYGIIKVWSHGFPGGFDAVSAERSAAGLAACQAWSASENGLVADLTGPIHNNNARVAVLTIWLQTWWKPNRDAAKGISFMDPCRAGATPPGDISVIDAVGGLAAFGHVDLANCPGNTANQKLLLGRMTGAIDGGRNRSARKAFDAGGFVGDSTFSTGFRMSGTGWVTLAPGVAAVWPTTALPTDQAAAGAVLFDTYMNDGVSANDVGNTTPSGLSSGFRWFHGVHGYGVSWDTSKNGTAGTIRVDINAIKATNTPVGVFAADQHQLDGNNVAPNGDGVSKSY